MTIIGYGGGLRQRYYYVYIMASENRTLYTGVTNDVLYRTHQHRECTGSKFTSKYKVNKLVYFESFRDINEAIDREKRIKGLLRSKKVALIEAHNAAWEDISHLVR